MYSNMPIALQVYNTFRRRWCSAYWQANGITVIPAVTWSNDKSFDFCFDGIEKGCVVAVSTVGSRKIKELYLAGFDEMIRRIEPEAVICYYRPFDEMKRECRVIEIPYEGLTVRSPAKDRRAG